MEELKGKVITVATSLALQESEANGKDYSKCINMALDEACIRLGVSSKELIKIFL